MILERIEDHLVVRALVAVLVLSGLRALADVIDARALSPSTVASIVFALLLAGAIVAIQRDWAPTLLVGRVVYIGVALLTLVQLASLAGATIDVDVRMVTASLGAAELVLAGHIVYGRRSSRVAATVVVLGYLATVLVLGLPRVITGIVAINLVVIALLVDLVVSSRRRLRSEAVHQHELAVTDELTGLPNRRGAVDVLEEASPPTAVILFDVDRFKQINDRLGHEAGDDVLREIAATIREAVRDVDVAARWGGEEFLVVLRRTDDAALVAERVRRAVATATGGVTISAGVSIMVGDETWQQAVRRADARLYEAKQSGRDCVVAA